jgi:oligopeptide/dipeptide ABC transporter ATP-binding protein
MTTRPILVLDRVAKRFAAAGGRTVHAVTDVSLEIAPGEAVGLVGESGSGKSTIGLLATRLVAPSAGRVVFDGEDITTLGEQAMRSRRAALQIVFQDPWGAFNPRMTIGRALAEPLVLHARLDATALASRVRALADRVRLPAAALERYPHELSGGQLQRVAIARAIATEPRLVVLDEPTSSLDLSVRAGILDLLATLRRETGVAFLFISHDLETVERVTDRVVVLYLGEIAEIGPTRALFAAPSHPYTRALLSASLPADPTVRLARIPLAGEIPSPIDPPAGCLFASRCPVAMPACTAARPPRVAVGAAHEAACLRAAPATEGAPA